MKSMHNIYSSSNIKIDNKKTHKSSSNIASSIIGNNNTNANININANNKQNENNDIHES